MESLWLHWKYALRMVERNPGFSFAVVLTLALGIGGNAAVFTVTNAVLLKPLPYTRPNELVLLDVVHKSQGASNGFTLNRYDMLRDHVRSLASVAVATNDSLNLTGAGAPQQVPIARASGNFFETLGISPQLGRLFSESDARPESTGVAVLSDACWRTVFASDASVIGRTINLDSLPYTVVGILPANAKFPFLGAADIWLPRYFELSLFTPERLRLGVGYLTAIGRLAPGKTSDSAAAEMHVLDRQYAEQFPKAPDAGADIETHVTSLADSAVSNIRTRLLLLSAAVGFVLLIACANAANLLLWRAVGRSREIALRVVLGAGRRAIVAQLLTESLVLALIAGAVGLGFSFAALGLLVRLSPDPLVASGVALDWHVLLFTLAVSLLTGLGFGLAPAIQMSRPEQQSSLRAEGTWSTSTRGQAVVRNALVVAQVALSLALLIGSGLLIRSFSRLLHTTLGFDPENVLTMNVSLPTAKYSKADQQTVFFRELLPKLAALPGVRSAAISSALPPMKKRETLVLAEGQPDVPLPQRPLVTIELISPRWFETLGVPLVSGRDFRDADTATAPKVLIANHAFARRFWPNENPIGKHVEVGRIAGWEVVGVAGDVKNNGLAADPEAQLYIPFAQLPWASMNLLLRTSVEPHSVVSAVRSQVLGVDPDQPVSNIRTAEELMEASRSELRFTTLLMGTFSLTAFGLALIGLYSVLAYSVAQRRRELAIRFALGADKASVIQLVLNHGMRLVVIGVVAGIAISLVVARLMTGLLYHVNTIDPASFLLAPLLFLGTAALATYLPARRAASVSPWEALR
jgi:putative ABC transport system permease protein